MPTRLQIETTSAEYVGLTIADLRDFLRCVDGVEASNDFAVDVEVDGWRVKLTLLVDTDMLP